MARIPQLMGGWTPASTVLPLRPFPSLDSHWALRARQTCRVPGPPCPHPLALLNLVHESCKGSSENPCPGKSRPEVTEARGPLAV